MQVTDGEKLLKKYDLKPDDGILAQDKHASMYVCPVVDPGSCADVGVSQL